MTTKVKYETECDICGDPLSTQNYTIHQNMGMPEPYGSSGASHFRFDTCPECTEEMLNAKATLVDVMRMKRGNETEEQKKLRIQKRDSVTLGASSMLNASTVAGAHTPFGLAPLKAEGARVTYAPGGYSPVRLGAVGGKGSK